MLLMARRKLTRTQAKSRKALAVRFVRDVLGDPERAREIERESLDAWAKRTRRTITNPTKGTTITVANGPLKSDLQDMIDEAVGILSDAYDPMTSREQAMQAIADALDALEANGEEDEDENGDSDSDNGDDEDED
jgi:hypothetical protein